MVGFLSGIDNRIGPSLLSTLIGAKTVRGILAGSKLQFKDINHAIEYQNIKSMVNRKTFSFKEARKAYHYLDNQKHVGKVVITLP